MSTQSHPDQAAQRSPVETLTDMIMAYRLSQLIYVAARLGIADFLKDGPKSSEELAALVDVHPHALYRVLRALASNDIFAETEGRYFALTPLAEPLQTEVPGSVHGLAMMHNQSPRWRAWGELLYSVNTGKSAFEHIHGMSNWEYYASDPDVIEQFNEGMAELTKKATPAIVTAYDFAGRRRIVDVGAGRGHLMAAILEHNPQLCGVMVDVPALIEDARTVLEAAGVTARCELVAGDYFAPLPQGGDVYILKSIIHGMPEENALRLLRNCRQSMVDDGRVLVIQVIVPSGNEPAQIKVSDILHLVSGGGQERTEAEYRALFDAAGFKLVKVYPTATSFSILEGVPA
ncbi:MAG: methyltransferase [bacterium]|nr:methyltransferase [bacterium]